MDQCICCGLTYNAGERIPRIMVHCGHTFCTECLTLLHHNYRIRCPLCRKLIKQIENVERLPLNINILYEVVQRDDVLSRISFDEEVYEDEMEEKLCFKH